MAVVFVFTMLFALPTQRISAAEKNVDYNDALNTTIQKYIEKFQNGFSSNITWDSWAIIGLARSDKEVPKEIFDILQQGSRHLFKIKYQTIKKCQVEI